MQAHQAASRMFWSVYCDRYIEMIKDRLEGASPTARVRTVRIRTVRIWITRIWITRIG